VNEVEFPPWFEARRVQRLRALDDHHGGGWAELSRDTLLKAIDQVYRTLPQWSAEPAHAALAVALLNVLIGLAFDNVAKQLRAMAVIVRRNYADVKAGKPAAPCAPLVAALLAECERTRAALLACGASGEEAPSS